MKDGKNSNDNKNSNVIDLASRISQREKKSGFFGMKVRWDLERTKVAVSTSLLSVVLLVTLANNSIFKTAEGLEVAQLASESEPTEVVAPSRGIASVDNNSNILEDEMVKKLSMKDLGEESLGRKPSSVELFAFGFLEGKYIVKHSNGRIREVEYSSGSNEDTPKVISNRQGFLNEHRAILPANFDRPIRVGTSTTDEKVTEVYELLNSASMPVAKVQFDLDSDGRLLGLKVDRTALAR